MIKVLLIDKENKKKKKIRGIVKRNVSKWTWMETLYTTLIYNQSYVSYMILRIWHVQYMYYVIAAIHEDRLVWFAPRLWGYTRDRAQIYVEEMRRLSGVWNDWQNLKQKNTLNGVLR